MQRKILIACAAMSAFLAVPIAMGATPPSTQVSVAGGQLQGKAAGDVVSFKAVPYAAPPVGTLRWREPQRVLPYRVPWHPLTPIVFCLTCLYMLYASLVYTGSAAWIGLAVLASGIPVLYFRRSPADLRSKP